MNLRWKSMQGGQTMNVRPSLLATLRFLPGIPFILVLFCSCGGGGSGGSAEQDLPSSEEVSYLYIGEYDYGADGSIEDLCRYCYNGDGILIRYEFDEGGDGTVDMVHTYVWDMSFEPPRIQRKEADLFDDGSIDAVEYLCYDDTGLKIRSEIDNDNNGAIDELVYYGYNSAGELILEEHDVSCDGSVEYSFMSFYDKKGNLSHAYYYYGNDPVVDGTYQYFYDASGRLIRMQCDVYADGVIDLEVSYRTEIL